MPVSCPFSPSPQRHGQSGRLESRPGRGLVFAFTEPAWFITNAKTTFLSGAPIALVLMAMAVGMIGSFLL